MIDALFIIIFIFLGFFFIKIFKGDLSKIHLKNLRNLWLFHLLFGLVYFIFTKGGGGDSWGYWYRTKLMSSQDFWLFLTEGEGTRFMDAINYIPSNILGMGFLANTILFTLLGFIGIICFYKVCLKLIPVNTKIFNFKLFPTIFFLPMLHFWSSGVGKDTILFACIGLFVYSLLRIIPRLPILILAIVIAYTIRPHIAFFLIAGFGLAYIIDGNLSFGRRSFLSIIMVGAAILILPNVLEFAKMEEASVESFETFSKHSRESIINTGSGTGSTVDISSYPFVAKILTFLFRPFFFDINGIPAVVASFENLLLVILSLQIFRSKPVKTFKSAPLILKGLVFFLMIGTVAFSLSLNNLGIMIRMRNMFLPGLLIYILWSKSYKEMNKRKLHRIVQLNKNKII